MNDSTRLEPKWSWWSLTAPPAAFLFAYLASLVLGDNLWVAYVIGIVICASGAVAAVASLGRKERFYVLGVAGLVVNIGLLVMFAGTFAFIGSGG